MKNNLLVAAMCCVFFCALGGLAQSATLDAELERLAAETASIQYLKSDFKQTKYISFMDETLVSEGFFTFKAPDELEWEYSRPLASGLSYKGGKARLWSGAAGGGKGGGAEEAIAKVIAEQLITWTRLDIPKLKKSYNITMESDAPLTIRLTPKNLSPSNPVRDFRLIFAADGVTVRQITLFEAEDDYTQIDFSNFEKK